ncbi:MAG: Xaa-Pro aminopeptidase [Woeseiaceae bacterium]|jgi:Xaa-Pro aminopeptidase
MKHALRLAVASLLLSGIAQADDADIFKARRQAVMEAMDGGVAVLYGGGAGGGIVQEGFVQESSFYYLTGVSEPGAALILAPGDHRFNEILFLQRRDVEDENWNGRREPLGDALNEKYGFEQVLRINTLPGTLTAMLQQDQQAVFLGPVVGANSEIPASLKILRDAQARVPGATLVNMADLLPEMRRIKDDGEIELIQQAVDITGKGIVAAMQAVEPGMMEFQLQSVVEHTYEMEGAQFLGFSTILASGPNTTVLHYGRNNQPIAESGLVLVDTGAAVNHYTADVTRTFPVSGTFSARERELYELVLKAADAATKEVKVGAHYYDDIHMTAKSILDEAGYGKYFIHGVGHFVGLDVHDVGNRRLPLKEGVVITIEPGIYIPEEGIGIRIEDVVLVTRDGPVVLSRRIPRTVEEVEAAMAR